MTQTTSFGQDCKGLNTNSMGSPTVIGKKEIAGFLIICIGYYFVSMNVCYTIMETKLLLGNFYFTSDTFFMLMYFVCWTCNDRLTSASHSNNSTNSPV